MQQPPPPRRAPAGCQRRRCGRRAASMHKALRRFQWSLTPASGLKRVQWQPANTNRCMAMGLSVQGLLTAALGLQVPWEVKREGRGLTLLFEALALPLCREMAMAQAARLMPVTAKRWWTRTSHRCASGPRAGRYGPGAADRHRRDPRPRRAMNTPPWCMTCRPSASQRGAGRGAPPRDARTTRCGALAGALQAIGANLERAF